MITPTQTPRACSPVAAPPVLLPAALTAVVALLTAGFSVDAAAQQITNPGDIIVERTITPRDAFVPVPKSQDPVAVRATTFSGTSFNPAMAQVVGDTDLTNAHGSSGVAGNGVLGGSGMQAVMQILSGKATGNTVALNAGGIGNAQNNCLAASTTTVDAHHSKDVAIVATDQNSQTANLSFTGSFEGTAMLGNNTLQYSSGNIGVNIAGGAGNLQHNGLAIAALNSSK